MRRCPSESNLAKAACASAIVEMLDQLVGRPPGLGGGAADDHVQADPE